MLIPWDTDAPCYHFPWATIGLIVLNVLLFGALVVTGGEGFEDWILTFGDGLHPLQWISNHFLHADVMHLVGNMIFLWAFGLVVEGKLGWKVFLPLYLAMGLVYGLIIQIVMSHGEGGALGASGVIYSLLMMCLLWAPKNEFSCLLILGFRISTFEMPIMAFAGLYLALQLVFAWLRNFSMSSEMLHLTGAGIGLVVGWVMMRREWVDCEGWDLLSVWAGREGEKKIEKAAEQPKVEEFPLSRLNEAHDQVRRFVQEGNAAAALTLDNKMTSLTPEWMILESDLLALIKLFQQEKKWQSSVDLLVRYIKRFPQRCHLQRLRLAQILTLQIDRPQKALDVLAKVNASALTPEQAEFKRKLEIEAKKRAADAELEVEDDEDW